MTENGVYYTRAGHQVQMSLYGFDLLDAPCVVYLHGFKGFKDWGFVPVTGKFFESQGLRFLAMNFSHNGIGDDPEQFTELDKFRDNTFSLELAEALEVIQAYAEGRIFKVQPGARLGLLGHSRGGGIALLAGERAPEISAVCTWAAVSTFRRYPPETIAQWERDGVLPIVNSRTGQVMELGWQIHADLMDKIDGELSIERAVRNLGKPLQVIHGTADPAVSVADAHHIVEWAGPEQTSLHVLEGADHVFGARHPFAGTTPHLEEVWKTTLQFFKSHL